MNIRLLQADDYPALADIWNAAYADAEGNPVLPVTAEVLRQDDAEQDPKVKAERWLYLDAGRPVGLAEFDQEESRYHPQKFWVDMAVLPGYQGRGIGTRLYDHLLGRLEPHCPIALRSTVREDLSGVPFLAKRGWKEEARIWESYLDLEKADLSAYPEVIERLAEQGVEIKTYLELESDPERDRKLYDLSWELRQDMPEVDAATQEDFETFVEKRLRHPSHLLDAYFVAVRNGEYLALSYYRKDETDETLLKTGLSGVVRSERGRGLAYALKLHGLRWARSRGYKTARTVNESTNRRILAINERLGFEKRPAWLDFVKRFGDA